MFSCRMLQTQHATRARGRPTFQHTPSKSLCGFVEIRAQTAASHHTMPTGACQSAPDVRPGALGGRRAGFEVATYCSVAGPGILSAVNSPEPKLHGRRSSRVLMFGVLEHPGLRALLCNFLFEAVNFAEFVCLSQILNICRSSNSDVLFCRLWIFLLVNPCLDRSS